MFSPRLTQPCPIIRAALPSHCFTFHWRVVTYATHHLSSPTSSAIDCLQKSEVWIGFDSVLSCPCTCSYGFSSSSTSLFPLALCRLPFLNVSRNVPHPLIGLVSPIIADIQETFEKEGAPQLSYCSTNMTEAILLDLRDCGIIQKVTLSRYRLTIRVFITVIAHTACIRTHCADSSAGVIE